MSLRFDVLLHLRRMNVFGSETMVLVLSTMQIVLKNVIDLLNISVRALLIAA